MCALSIILSVIMSGVMLSRGDNLVTAPFSEIGEQNRALFVIWGATTAAALFYNLRLLASRLSFHGRAFNVIAFVGCGMVIVTSSVVGLEPVRRIIHITSAALFGGITALCILFLLIVKFKLKKNRKRTATYIFLLAIAAVIFIFATISAGWFTASTQMLIINVALVTMFFSNFVEKWTIAPHAESPEVECPQAIDKTGDF